MHEVKVKAEEEEEELSLPNNIVRTVVRKVGGNCLNRLFVGAQITGGKRTVLAVVVVVVVVVVDEEKSSSGRINCCCWIKDEK